MCFERPTNSLDNLGAGFVFYFYIHVTMVALRNVKWRKHDPQRTLNKIMCDESQFIYYKEWDISARL